MLKFILVAFLTFFLPAFADYEWLTSCKNINVQDGLNVSAIFGTWNVVKYGSSFKHQTNKFQEINGCVKIDFIDMFPGENGTHGAYIHAPSLDELSNERSANMMGVTIPDPDKQPGRMIISNHYLGEYAPTVEYSLHILHSDYKTTLGLFCMSEGSVHDYWIGMVSREKTLDESVFAAYKYILQTHGIVSEYIHYTHENCPNEWEWHKNTQQ